MGGYGRGARMKIEADQIEWLSGVRAGETLGSPIAMLVGNRDWEHWRDVVAPAGVAGGGGPPAGSRGARARVRGPPISPARSSTTARTHGTSWSGRARRRRWRGSP